MKEVINEIAWELFYDNISSNDLGEERVFEKIIQLLEKKKVFDSIQDKLEVIEQREKGVNDDY